MKHIQRSIRSVPILLACALALPPLLAFHIPGQPPGPPINQVYPGANGLADFRKIVSGEFTGNKTRDAVFLDLDEDTGLMHPTLLVSPEFFDTSIRTGAPANDIAVLSGVVDGKDLLVAAEADGVKIYERTIESTWVVTQAVEPAGPFAGAAFVAVGDVNGDGFPDLVAVLANKRDVTYAYGDGSKVFQQGPTVVCPTQVVHQLQLMNWTDTNDPLDTDETVVHSNLGWGVCEDSGLWRKVVSWPSAPVRGTVLRNPTGGPDRLANTVVWNNSDRLSISDESTTTALQNLGPINVVALAAADVSVPPDGDVDLILTNGTDRYLYIYENQSPNTPTFSVANPVKYFVGPDNRNPAMNQTGPEGITVGDFDADGHQDVLVTAQGNPDPGPLGPWSSYTIIRPDPDYDDYLCKVSAGYYVPSPDPEGGVPDRIQLTFDGAMNPPLQAGSGEVAELLVNLYYCPGLGQPVSPIPFAVGHLDIPASFLHDTDWQFDLPENFDIGSSTDFFALVAYQRIVVDGVTTVKRPAEKGWISPGPNMFFVKNSKDSIWGFDFINWDDEAETTASWDQGPTVPPTPPDEEPVEDPKP